MRPSPHGPAVSRTGSHDAGTVVHALEEAVNAAMAAPSVLNTQPWQLVLHRDHLELRADRTRLVRGLDTQGRALMQGVGSAMANARVSLAAQGFAAHVHRLPDPGDADLLARVFPVEGAPDPCLVRLGPAVDLVRTGRPVAPAPGGRTAPSEALLRALAAAVVDEGAVLFPVLTGEQHRLIDRLTDQAQTAQAGDPTVLAALRQWTHRSAATGDGVLSAAAFLPDATTTMVVVATHADAPLDHLVSGEAMQRVLLEVALLGWQATPVPSALQLNATRADLRAELTFGTWPQALLQITRWAQSPPTETRRRRRTDVVLNSTRPAGSGARAAARQLAPAHTHPGARRTVSDGRGGTRRIETPT